MLPEAGPVGLVPDFKIIYLALISFYNGRNVVFPGSSFFLCVNGRTSNRAENLFSRLGIKSVAVAKAEPGLNFAAYEVVNYIVKPLKGINALFLFCFCPTRL